MFKIGQFSKIAQVSGRLLRYYDKIGLLQPEYTDPETGYRYYTAEQLPRLNRILALKELGFSLEQIDRLLHSNLSADEIRGMLTIKKAQIEQTLQEEVSRLQQVELRLRQIEHEGEPWGHDVIIKEMAAQPFLSIRRTATAEENFDLFRDLTRLQAVNPGKFPRLGHMLFILHSDIMEEAVMDIEVGFLLNGRSDTPLLLESGHTLTASELPAVSQMATIAQYGWAEGALSYAALGQWIADHGYQIVGPGRELFLDLGWPDPPNNSVYEIQFPVAPAGRALSKTAV